MEIFKINDRANMKTIYFVPDATIQEQCKALHLSGKNICNIGTLDDAQTQLTLCQQEHLLKMKNLFHANIQHIDADGYVVWTPCDLSIELPNISTIYQAYNAVDNAYYEAIGLDAVNALILSNKQQFLTFAQMDTVITLTELPIKT